MIFGCAWLAVCRVMWCMHGEHRHSLCSQRTSTRQQHTANRCSLLKDVSAFCGRYHVSWHYWLPRLEYRNKRAEQPARLWLVPPLWCLGAATLLALSLELTAQQFQLADK
jgi:hypothetical protein